MFYLYVIFYVYKMLIWYLNNNLYLVVKMENFWFNMMYVMNNNLI